MTKKTIFIFIVVLINGLTHTSGANLLITIPQLFIVIYYIVTGKTNKAIFWHFIFFITSFTYSFDLEGVKNELTSYNYAKLKFFGSIGYSHIISLFLMFIVNVENKKKIIKEGLYYDLYKLLIFFIISGFGIGLINLLIGDYYLEGLKIYGSYILIIFIHADILMKANNRLLRKYFTDIMIPLLTIVSIVNFIIHLIYPEFFDLAGISLFSALLLPALLFQKKTRINLIGLFFVVYNMVLYRSSGKELIFLLIIILMTIILSFDKNIKKTYPLRTKFIRVTLMIILISIPTIYLFLFNTYSGSSLIVSKFAQVESLGDFILFQGSIQNIATSPYVRVTSLLNILHEGILNPFQLLFGKGYGGYFQDNLQYFSNLDLTQGGFSDKAILSGDFYTGHDALVTVPMFNGIVGLYLLLKIVWKSIRFSKRNYLILSAIPFLLLVFYFDTLIGVSGVLLFYLGSFDTSKSI